MSHIKSRYKKKSLMDLESLLQQFTSTKNMPISGPKSATSLLPRVTTLAGQLFRTVVDLTTTTTTATESIQTSTVSSPAVAPNQALSTTATEAAITTTTAATTTTTAATTPLAATLWSYLLSTTVISTLMTIFSIIAILGLLCTIYIYRNSICCACCFQCRWFTAVQNRLGLQAAHSVRTRGVQVTGALAYGMQVNGAQAQSSQVNGQQHRSNQFNGSQFNSGQFNGSQQGSSPFNGQQANFGRFNGSQHGSSRSSGPQSQPQNINNGPIQSFKPMAQKIKKDCSFEILQV